MSHQPTVLFVCVENSNRSQMAEALLKRYARSEFEVYSAGIDPKPIHPLTELVIEELGIDMSDHYSKSCREFLGYCEFDFLIIVCELIEPTCPRIFPGARVRWLWPFEDPAKCDGSEWTQLEKFREVRDAIAEKLHTWLEVVPAW